MLVENRYRPVTGSAVASVQVESGNGIQRHPSAPGISIPSVREMGAPSGPAAADGADPPQAGASARRRERRAIAFAARGMPENAVHRADGAPA
jgi:hypothetical protein